MLVLEQFEELGLAQKARPLILGLQIVRVQYLDRHSSVRQVEMHSLVDVPEGTAIDRFGDAVVAYLFADIGDIPCLFAHYISFWMEVGCRLFAADVLLA